MTEYSKNLIVFWYVCGVVLTCVGGLLLGLATSHLNRLKREVAEFQRYVSRETAELTKWQGELERKASKLHEQNFYKSRYPQ